MDQFKQPHYPWAEPNYRSGIEPKHENYTEFQSVAVMKRRLQYLV
jgi:hypothetical protein